MPSILHFKFKVASPDQITAHLICDFALHKDNILMTLHDAKSEPHCLNVTSCGSFMFLCTCDQLEAVEDVDDHQTNYLVHGLDGFIHNISDLTVVAARKDSLRTDRNLLK